MLSIDTKEISKNKLTSELTNNIISMGWSDKISFEYIFHRTGLTEGEVIKVMRKKLKHKSFKNWRKRVNGRKSKHRKLNELRDD